MLTSENAPAAQTGLSAIRKRFPIFQEYPELAYLDNAATTQRVDTVIDDLDTFHRKRNATVHRGVYTLSAEATRSFEDARAKVARFLGANDPETIAFTRGTTESINIVASSFLKRRIRPGDNIVISIMEHHANFIPWQMLCQENGAELRIVPLSENGDLDLKSLGELMDPRTRLLSVTHISNTLGTVNPVDDMIAMAHRKDIPVLVDAAQSAALYSLDVSKLNCDFLAFSAHKAFGPFGVGALYVRDRYKAEMKPYTWGGGIVKNVTTTQTDFRPYPYNMDSGTPNVSGVLGLSSALDFIHQLDREECRRHVRELSSRCHKGLAGLKGVRILGDPEKASGIISFCLDEIHPHDVASFLNEDNIAVRAGMHCTQPLLTSLGLTATVRVSFSIYNTPDEVDRLVYSLKELKKFWE